VCHIFVSDCFSSSNFQLVAMGEPTADITLYVAFPQELAIMVRSCMPVPFALAKKIPFRPLFDIGLIVNTSFTKRWLTLITKNVYLRLGLCQP